MSSVAGPQSRDRCADDRRARDCRGERPRDTRSVGQLTRRNVNGSPPAACAPPHGAAADSHARSRTLPLVPAAVIAFDFDPFLHLGDGVVRWETLGIAAAIFVAIVLAALGAPDDGPPRRRPALRRPRRSCPAPSSAAGSATSSSIPTFFAAQPGAILDPGVGSLELGLAVVGGAITGGDRRGAARRRRRSLAPRRRAAGPRGHRRWQARDGPRRDRPGPAVRRQLGDRLPRRRARGARSRRRCPSHPSQAYEGIATLVILVVLMGAARGAGAPRGPTAGRSSSRSASGRVARSIVATTWRDPADGRAVPDGAGHRPPDRDRLSRRRSSVLVRRERPASPAPATG